ncbi:winged helix-turn-helix transcriptional regulator [Nocardia callitridis]|uniref:winged helix-turn-helix transcriptional regulator n=1 Tax=Nocardia callitridis TaxID=648753 RepID=UPI0031E9CC9C
MAGSRVGHRPASASRTTLRRLESHGLVGRHAFTEVVSPRVEYELTELGARLIDPIHTSTEWARADGDAVRAALDANSATVTVSRAGPGSGAGCHTFGTAGCATLRAHP